MNMDMVVAAVPAFAPFLPALQAAAQPILGLVAFMLYMFLASNVTLDGINSMDLDCGNTRALWGLPTEVKLDKRTPPTLDEPTPPTLDEPMPPTTDEPTPPSIFEASVSY